jgi:nucleotide-binding universal stress UspA family protein
MAIRKILVPIDFSPCSLYAFDRTIELAKTLSARIDLLHSYAVSISQAPSLYWGVPPDFLAKLRQAAAGELEQLAKRATEAGVACESHVSSELPVDAILATARALPADLIAMGTHGLTGVMHALLGSTAERIVRLAPCPVLTFKQPE